MSSYAEKRRPQPGCRVPDCTEPAVILAIRQGILGWYCPGHKNK